MICVTNSDSVIVLANYANDPWILQGENVTSYWKRAIFWKVVPSIIVRNRNYLLHHNKIIVRLRYTFLTYVKRQYREWTKKLYYGWSRIAWYRISSRDWSHFLIWNVFVHIRLILEHFLSNLPTCLSPYSKQQNLCYKYADIGRFVSVSKQILSKLHSDVSPNNFCSLC